jgi:two-component system CheB/CheR fusion protein
VPKEPKPNPRTKKSPAPSEAPRAIPVVGIGASAGGLEAFGDLLSHLPTDTGMAFVLVQHLDPKHESALTKLLARKTSLPVAEVTQNLRVQPDNVYVIPPDTKLSIEEGVLKLEPRGTKAGPARSIDQFFQSLALDCRERAIGVVLSGTANDGTVGLEAIKAEGGVSFAQDESAKYDSMPRSAIAAGCVDFVLPPEKIAAELARIARHPLVTLAPVDDDPPDAAPDGRPEPKRTTPDADAEDLRRILLLLRDHRDVDFSLYKSSTIQRRVARRLVINRHETLADYATFLKGNPKELDALYADVLINVTSFFRNPEAFEALRRRIFPKLLAQRRRGEAVRVWVPGCSTGQEAYSLAMTFAEAVDDAPDAPKLQIFATDINEGMLDRARTGFYARSLVQNLSPERLRRFFVEEEGGYRLLKTLRDQVVFARQNVTSDPPFSRLDLITCRNLLIYLEPGLQKRILPAFHYALKPGGFLFLGASESVGTFTDLFAPVEKKQKIFSRKAATTPPFRLALPGRGVSPAPTTTPAPGPPGGGELDAQREADRIAITQFAPAGVLVDAADRVVQFRGGTGAYLEPPRGKASFDLLKMARPGLLLPLRTAIGEARRRQQPVRREGIQLDGDGQTPALTLHVFPLRNLKEDYLLVVFEERAERCERPGDSPPSPPLPRPATKEAASRRVAELERELAETRDYLQSVQEQNEAANEELQSSSEELQSGNEELQSINEELETSKEELESANEELTTINDELAGRNAELSRLNADINNLQVSTRTAILLLGRDLTVRRFTPAAEKIFKVLATDVGRPLGALRHSLDAPDLESIAASVIDTVTTCEREVRDHDGRWYGLRAHPYFTLDNKIDGVVLVLTDIDALKRGELEIKASRDYAQATLRTLPTPFLLLAPDLRVTTASEDFYTTFRVPPDETSGRTIYELGNGQWDIPALRELLEDILPRQSSFRDYEVTHHFESIGTRTMLLHGCRLDTEAGAPAHILLAIDDITGRVQAEATLRHTLEEVERVSRAKDDFLATLSHELRTPLTPVLMAASVLERDASLPSAAREAFAMIRRNVGLEARLIDDMLDLTRISRGLLKIDPEPTDLHDLLEQTIQIVRGGKSDAHAPITAEFGAERHHAMADPTRMKQVFWNLLNNALKFTAGDGSVTVRTHNDSSGALVICVVDTGIGIPAHALPKIFQTFEQGDVAGQPRYGGIGLGLAISHSIVHMHGGTLRAASEGVDRGATFTVSIGTIAPSADPTARKAPLPAATRTLRLLLVEDHPATRTVLEDLLTGFGHRVTTAATLAEARAKFSAEPCDAVISDLGLPDGSGLDLMREIQRQRPVPAVALSGYGMEEDHRKSQDAGFFAHLVKPVTIDQISGALEAIARRVL